jgi:hypothetical protein
MEVGTKFFKATKVRKTKKTASTTRQKSARGVVNPGCAVTGNDKRPHPLRNRRARIAPTASKDTPPLSSPSGNNGSISDELVRAWARPPDPSSAEIRGQIISILLDGKLSTAQQRAKIAEAVVLAVAERGQFFFELEQRDFRSTMFFDSDRKRLELISGDPFHAWLSDWLRINRADPIFTHIISEIQTVALNEKYSKGIVPEKFWATRSGAIYLSNGDANLVRITPDSVTILDNGTDGVLFVAGDTLKRKILSKRVQFFVRQVSHRHTVLTWLTHGRCRCRRFPNASRLFASPAPLEVARLDWPCRSVNCTACR